MELGIVIKKFISKKGHEVIIRTPKWEDLDSMLEFANALSKEDTFVLLNGITLTRDDEIAYLSTQIAGMEKKTKIHLVATVKGKFAANCGIDIDRWRKKHVGLIHISVTEQFREEGIGIELMNALISEAKKMGLRVLTLTCLENNTRALHVYEKIGFQKAGIIPKAILYHGEYVGEIQMYLQIA
jgi:RimJ/RimL family protein N-acetyltransferase